MFFANFLVRGIKLNNIFLQHFSSITEPFLIYTMYTVTPNNTAYIRAHFITFQTHGYFISTDYGSIDKAICRV